MNEKALVIPEATHLMPAMTVGHAMTRYNTIVSFVRQVMKDGVDFGTVPGTDKPTLLKPGAEKLTTLFGLTPQFPIVREVEDWDGKDHGGEPFFDFWYKCQLWRGDTLIAEADGSCNSRESKYRWRWVSEEDIPPGMNKTNLKTRRGSLIEFDFAVDKAETGGKYGKPAEYWQAFKDAIANNTAIRTTRKTRDGREFAAWQIDTTVYRVPNEDIFSQVNTMQKMAQKRALVAATLLAVNASEFFTQDLEDLDPDTIDANYTVIPGNGGNATPAWTAETVAAGEDEPKQTSKGKPKPSAKKNGWTTGELRDAMEKLLVRANEATDGYYEKGGTSHLFQTMKQENDGQFEWGNPNDAELWDSYLDVLMRHAESKEEGQSELPI